MSNIYAEPNVPIGMNAFGEWISEVFKLWAAQWSVWVLQGLIYYVVAQLPGQIIQFSQIGAMFSAGFFSRPPATPPEQTMILSIFNVISAVASLIMLPGMVYTALKQLRGETISVGDLFGATRFAWGVFVSGIAVALGMIACCVGVFATDGLFFLAIPLMIDRKVGIIAALQLSWQTASKNFWLFVLFALVMSILTSAGSFLCIGLIVTAPFLLIAQAVAYHHIFSRQTEIVPPITTGSMPPPYLPTEPPAQPAQSVPPVQTTEANGDTQNIKTCQHCGSIIPSNFTVCPNCNQPV